MRYLIVNPKLELPEQFIDYPYYINYAALVFSSFLKKKGHQVKILDSFSQPETTVTKKNGKIILGSGLYPKIKESNFDNLIIINSPFLDNRKEYVSKLKKLGKKIILADFPFGGMHYMEYDENKIDAEVWKYRSDSLLLGGKKHEVPDINNLPLPDWGQINLSKYLEFLTKLEKFENVPWLDATALPLYTSTGCIFNCKFCTNNLNKGYSMYSSEKIENYVKDLKKKNINKVVILDNLVNPSEKRLKELLSVLFKHKIRADFPNGFRLDKLTPELMLHLNKVTNRLKFSIECGDTQIRKKIGKNLTNEKIREICGVAKKLNMNIQAHFLLGLPDENMKTANKTLSLAMELYKVYGCEPLIQNLVPLKGTAIKSPKYPKSHLEMVHYLNSKPFLISSISDNLEKAKKAFYMQKNKKHRKIILNLTYKCNNNCIFCAVGDRRDIKESKIRQIEFLKKSAREGISEIDIDGGEPTLAPHLFEILGLAKKLNFKINLITNARMLSYDKFRNKILKFVDAIIVSIHGSTKKVHEKITRTPGSFKQTYSAIEKIRKECNEFAINTTICKDNSKDLPYIWNMIKHLGVKKWTLQSITPFGNANKKQLALTSDLKKIFENERKIQIQMINTPFCYLPGYEAFLVKETDKNERQMMFCNGEVVDLYDYLSKKRKRTAYCKDCPYYVCCSGKYVW